MDILKKNKILKIIVIGVIVLSISLVVYAQEKRFISIDSRIDFPRDI